MTPDEHRAEAWARDEERRRAEGVRRWLVYRLGDRAWGEEERLRELGVLAAALRRDPGFLGWFMPPPPPEPEPVPPTRTRVVPEDDGTCSHRGCRAALPEDRHHLVRYCSEACRRAEGRAKLRDKGWRQARRPRMEPLAARCRWCERALPPDRSPRKVYCSRSCRNSAYRAGRRRESSPAG